MSSAGIGRFGRLLVLGALGAFASCREQTRVAAPPTPSVLLVTLDTTRADALGCYGSTWADASPHLDRFAAEGVRFAQARTAAVMTQPSHASIMTGLWPFETGVRDNATFKLAPELETLAERFRAAGFTTGAVVASYVLHSVLGLDQGFDAYLDPPRSKLESGMGQDERTAGQVVDAAIGLFEEGKLRPPFFLWAHFFDPHFPFEPPEPFFSKFLKDVATGGKGRARYAAEVAAMDQEIGRLLAFIETRAAPGELVVAIVADHGEAIGDHGEDSHGVLLFDPTVRVPFLLRAPKLPRGRVVEAPVSTVDVAPTLLGLAGVPGPEGGVSGADLVPVVQAAGTPGGPPPARPIYAETLSPYLSYGWSPLFTVLCDGFKFIEGPRPALFDLAQDPGEERDLHDRHPEVVARARELLASLRPRAIQPLRRELDAYEAARFAAIGYVGGSGPDPGRPLPGPGEIDPERRDPRDGVTIIHQLFEIEAHVKAGRVPKALALSQGLLDEDPENPMVLQSAGGVLLASGRHEQALPVLEKVVRLRGDASSRYSLGLCLVRLGQTARAIETLEAALELHGEFLRSRLLLGELLVDAGRGAEAAVHLDYFLEHYEPRDAARAGAEDLRRRAGPAGAGGKREGGPTDEGGDRSKEEGP